MLNCLRIALICGVVVALAGCGKRGPLDAPGEEESKSHFDTKRLISRNDNTAPKATPPKECKSTFLDPLVGAECPPPKAQ